jgi:hypothetical protein
MLDGQPSRSASQSRLVALTGGEGDAPNWIETVSEFDHPHALAG